VTDQETIKNAFSSTHQRRKSSIGVPRSSSE
jgi:hypothetical protein